MPEEEVVTHIRLPVRTDSATAGPCLHFGPPILTVKYDCEQEDGTVIEAMVRFDDVMAFEYREDACTYPLDFEGYNRVAVFRYSEWLSDVTSRSLRAIARECSPSDGAAAIEGLQEYRVYFDDYGSIAVIARGFDTVPPLPVPDA